MFDNVIATCLTMVEYAPRKKPTWIGTHMAKMVEPQCGEDNYTKMCAWHGS